MEITNKSQAISIDAYVKQVQAQPKTEPAGECCYPTKVP